MSYQEYRDMFYKAQKNNAPYIMFTVDIKGSKDMSDYERFLAQEKLIALHEEVFLKSTRYEINMTTLNGRVPIKQFLGDACGWWARREHEEQLLKDIEEELSKLDFTVRLAKGYFETTEYCRGLSCYYGGYCFAELTNAHKHDGCGNQYVIGYYGKCVK